MKSTAYAIVMLFIGALFLLPMPAAAQSCAVDVCVEENGACHRDDCVYYCYASVEPSGPTYATVYVLPVLNGEGAENGCAGVEVFTCPSGDIRVGAFSQDGAYPPRSDYCDPSPPIPGPVQSCAVAGHSGVGIVYNSRVFCLDSPNPCPTGYIGFDLGTIDTNSVPGFRSNTPGCLLSPSFCDTLDPHPGWTVGAYTTCVGMYWVDVQQNVSPCKVRVRLHDPAGNVLFTVCQ